jgi:hypothetical protein
MVSNQAAALVKSNPDLKAILDGHTDLWGGDDYNMDLSNKRVKETCKYFSISFLYYSFTLKPLQIHFKIQVQLWFDSDCFVELSFTCIFLLEDQYLICFMKMVPGSLLHLLRYLVFEEGTCNIFVS